MCIHMYAHVCVCACVCIYVLVGAVGVCMWRLENNLESLSLGVVHLRETGSFIGQLDQ